MQSTQYKWLESRGWIPKLPKVGSDSPCIILAFGARPLVQQGDLLAELRDHFQGATLLGCSTSGEISGNEVSDDSLVATVISFKRTRFQTAVANTAHEPGHWEVKSSFEVGKELAEQLNDANLCHVFVISDGLNVNGSDLARGIASGVSKDVSITGGLSGDGADFSETWVVIGDEESPQRVGAIGFYGNHLKISYGSMGGWQAFGPVREITRAEGNILYELDGTPALDLYKTYLGKHAKELPAAALLFPIVVTDKLHFQDENASEGVIRTVLSVDDHSHSMTFAGDIPPQGTAQLMKTNVDNLVNGAESAGKICHAGLGKRTADLIVLVSCIGRKLVMKQRVEEEVEAVRDVFGDNTSIAGFYSYGELCPCSQGHMCRLHNQTMTITAFAED